ncbi:TetR family transcriptional regulator C-terminal domain-containing protein, partial [Micrococcus luteus]
MCSDWRISSPPGSDCDELASFFWVGWEGAILRARLTRDV